MSQDIDIMCVGGPLNGRQFCKPKWTRGDKIIDVQDDMTNVTYTLGKWIHPSTGERYHIATRVEDAVTNEQIVVEILIGNFAPAWDLNR